MNPNIYDPTFFTSSDNPNTTDNWVKLVVGDKIKKKDVYWSPGDNCFYRTVRHGNVVKSTDKITYYRKKK